MQRNSLFLLLFCSLLLTFGCNTPSNGTADNNTDTVEVDDEDMTDNDVDMGTDPDAAYQIRTIDETIKSPRKELTGQVDDVNITINYGSPAVNERTIYGDLVPYGKVWRTGANEATRITFDQPVKVGAEMTMLPAGTYSLFTLPADKNNWTIIFNKTADQWGAYDYAEDQDIARITGEAEMVNTPAERMDFALDGNEVELVWSDMKISFDVMGAE